MFQIVIVPANSSANTALSFKSKDNYEIARKNIHEKMKGGSLIVQDDDAGQTVEINADNISYCMYIDLAKQQEFAVAARNLAQAAVAPPKTLEEELAA